MEEWNDGMMSEGCGVRLCDFAEFRYSTIPSFQYSSLTNNIW